VPGGGVDVWDLRLIGERLRQRGLQQGWPRIAPSGPPGKPLRVTIDRPEPPEAALLRLTLTLFERPFDAEARYQRGLILCNGTPGQQQLAHADLTLAIMQAHKNSAEAHHRRGRLEERAGRWKEAVDDYTAALAGLPGERGNLLCCRGRCRILLRQYDGVADDLEEALPLGCASEAERARANRDLAHAYLWGARKAPAAAEVVKLARRAVDRYPASGGFWVTLGLAHYRAGQWDEGVKAIEESLRQADHPTRGLGLLVLAACHRKRNDEGKAKEALARAERWAKDAKALVGGAREEFDRFLPEAKPD
jgi:tetratricopeptide (TPR) repeat protein